MERMKVVSFAKIGVVAATLTLVGCGGDAGDSDGGPDGNTTHNNTTCDEVSGGVSGNKIVLNVTWPETLGVEGGSGQVIIWTRSKLTGEGNGKVSGEVYACGSYVPPLQTKAIIGGAKVQPLIPDEVWDSGELPATEAHGSISGREVGATIDMEPAGSVLGAKMLDPINDAWPTSWQGLELVDADGSGKPGLTAYPNDADGFSPPPLDVFPDGPKAASLFLATRTVMQIQGKRTSCTSASGDVIVHSFDNHVVGCTVVGGGDCDASQVDFVDNNRTIFEVGEASYEMVQVPDDATCADVRAALP